MSTIEKLKSTIDEWMTGLDTGDIERMIATCDPEAITCNEYQPTEIGIDAIRAKYEPRIKMAKFKSTLDIQTLTVFGDFALVVSHFTVEMTNRETEKQTK